MGQKVHAYGIRLGYTKPWKAKWFSRRDYQKLLIEDLKIREEVKALLKNSGVGSVDIERSINKVRVKIYSARPGIIIGRKGQEIDKLRNQLQKFTEKEIFIDIKEVKNPQIHAQLVAENIAQQIERRVAYRKAMKKAVAGCMMRGGDGIKIQCSGRLGGAEIARVEGYKEGKIPLSTFRANIDYGFVEARTTYGVIGVKVWIFTQHDPIEEEVQGQEQLPESRTSDVREEGQRSRKRKKQDVVSTEMKED